MRDVNALLFPNETVEYQFSYPLWMKLVAAGGMVWAVWALYDDITNGRQFFIVVEVLLLGYLAYWLYLMVRTGGQYVITNLRVMNLGKTPDEDVVIEYPQVREVKVLRDTISGNRTVQVTAHDAREIQVPIPGMAQARSLELTRQINTFRGIDPDAPAGPEANKRP